MSNMSLSAYEELLGSENIDGTADPPVLLPPNEHLLSEIVRKACSDNQKIAIAGKGTFPTPQPLHDGIVVSTKALPSVIEVNPEDFIVLTQAGAVVDNVVREAEQYGLLMPLDITSGNEATVGGAFMTGAVGPSAAGYGKFHESVIGVRCVTADGEIITGGGRTAKNVTGFDITRFLAGTMGLFAIAFELTVRVHTVPESRMVVAARFLPGSKPFHAVKKIVSGVTDVTMLELIALDGLGEEIAVGVGLEGMETIVRRSADIVRDILSTDGAIDVSEVKRKTFMLLRREASKNMVGPGFFTVSVPPSSTVVVMEKILAFSDSMPVLAHPALGRLHVICRNEELINRVRETVLAVGGKHPVAWSRVMKAGISCLFTEAEREIARTLKLELDPLNIFNPHLQLL